MWGAMAESGTTRHMSVKTLICQTHHTFLIENVNDVFLWDYCIIMSQELVLRFYSQKELVVCAQAYI